MKKNRHRPFDFRQKKIPSPSGSTSVNRPTNAMMMIAVGVTVAILLAGMTMLSNITLALALNRGGLEAVEAMMGPLSETGLAAIQGLCANPAGIYFWTGFERLVAVGLHIALSVLVYVSVRRRDNWFWFPAAILLHTLVDMVTILANAWLPIAATEVIAALLTLGSIALARKVYIEEKEFKAKASVILLNIVIPASRMASMPPCPAPYISASPGPRLHRRESLKASQRPHSSKTPAIRPA